MLDIKLIRENPEFVRNALKKRGMPSPLEELIAKDAEWRRELQQMEELRKQRNSISREINELIKGKKDAKQKLEEAKRIPEKIKGIEEKLRSVEAERRQLELLIPNLPLDSVPLGKDEAGNKAIRKVDTPRKFKFTPKDHYELGEKLGILDFAAGAKLSGERFTVLKGAGAELSRALMNFMLQNAKENGHEEINPPLLVRAEMLIGTGQLPKFGDDLYKIERDGLYAIPTSEVPLVNLHADEILEYKDLPKSYCAFTPCFRREAGSHGKDTRGIIRQHQFDKVEMVVVCHQDDSEKQHLRLLKDAESVLQALELPYRVIELCAGDLGFGSAKTYDLEVWLPAQGKYREVASCSNCTDFQARRANIKYRGKDNQFKFCHTLNSSGLAIGRTLVAILENCQREDGTIDVPAKLQKLLGRKRIG
ncbi:MAG: serine--tRNA ligase [Candidatus Micrarchaeota archaeon]